MLVYAAPSGLLIITTSILKVIKEIKSVYPMNYELLGSALESNIGLNAICQFTANYPISIPHGLGTGAIYTDNIPSPLVVEQGNIFHDPERLWDTSDLN